MPGKAPKGECDCGVLHEFKNIGRHKLPNGEVCCICGICNRTWKEEKVSIQKSGMPNVVTVYIKKRSNGNVILHEILSATDPIGQYALRCTVCSTQLCWQWDFNYENGIDLEDVDKFCFNHAECAQKFMMSSEGKSSVLKFKEKSEA